jgi:hypothetical protein
MIRALRAHKSKKELAGREVVQVIFKTDNISQAEKPTAQVYAEILSPWHIIAGLLMVAGAAIIIKD